MAQAQTHGERPCRGVAVMSRSGATPASSVAVTANHAAPAPTAARDGAPDDGAVPGDEPPGAGRTSVAGVGGVLVVSGPAPVVR